MREYRKRKNAGSKENQEDYAEKEAKGRQTRRMQEKKECPENYAEKRATEKRQERMHEKQGQIHGHQLRTGGQGQKCNCPQLKMF